MSGEGADGDDGDENKQEYVKKEFVARPYECTSGVLEEIEKTIIKNSRPLLQMRISRQRKEFGADGLNLADKDAKDATEFTTDCKGTIKKIEPSRHKKKILDRGFQAAYQVKQIQTQTYFGRHVNKAC
jgi:hypothetical protein